MKTLLKVLVASFVFATAAQAGTINAPFYFSKDCLDKLAYEKMPGKLKFACNEEGQCFANDMALNNLLLCAHAFGDKEMKSDSIKTYQLSKKGFKAE